MGYAVYAAPSLLPRGNKAPDLEKLPWIGFDERLAHLQVARWFERVLPGVRPRLRIDSLATMQRAAAEGAGAAVLPIFAASQDRGLVRISDVVPDVSMDLWVLTHPDLRNNARVRALMEHLAAAIPAELEGIVERGPRCNTLACCPVAQRRARLAGAPAEASLT